jgi:hypothetical protein
VHFTREPIIESILSARDGYKLVLKSSKTNSSAEISAEVVEIVSFAGSVFYRSQDRSKNFLLPAADYEINEVKDARLVLKNISLEKSNKLSNPQKEQVVSDSESEAQEDLSHEMSEDQDQAQQTQSAPQAQSNSRLERRRERRRNRRRRHSEERSQEDKKDLSAELSQEQTDIASGEENQESIAPMPVPTLNLIPPPTTLISQTLARYKEKQVETEQVDSSTTIVENVSEPAPFQVPVEPEDLV